jgi:hypothetical protein
VPSPRGIVLMVLLLLMEILAGFSLAVGSSLLDATSLQYGMFWPFLLAGLAGIVVALAITAIRPRAPWDRVILLAGAAIAAIVPARIFSASSVSLIVAAILLAVAYWRGASVAQEVPNYTMVQGRFGIGFGVLFTGLVWTVARGIINQRALWHMLALVGIAYTIVAMVALVLGRIERTREPGATPAIVLAVGIQLGLLAIISLVASEIFSHDLASALFNLTRPVWNAIGPIWFNMLVLLFAPIQWLLDLIHAHAHVTHPLNLVHRPPGPQHLPHRHLQTQAVHTPFFAVAGLVLLLAVVAALAALIWKVAPRLSWRQRDPGYDEERLYGLSLAAIWRGFRRWLQGIFHRGSAATAGITGVVRRRIFGPVYPDDPVRRVYAQVLYRAAHLGVPRPMATTPSEFQSLLALAWPEGATDFAAVTNAYVRRRYGAVSFAQEEVEMLGERWHRLRRLMRRQTLAAPAQEDDLVTLDPPVSRHRVPMLGWLAESQTIRQTAMELTGSVIALIALFGFIIAAVVIGIVLNSR